MANLTVRLWKYTNIAKKYSDTLPKNVSITKMADLFRKDLVERKLDEEDANTPAT